METTGIGDVETGMGIITDAREQMRRRLSESLVTFWHDTALQT